MARFACLAAQQGLEHGQKEMATCSTCPGIARARPGARPRTRRAALSQTRAPARARAYKASRGFNRTPPRLLCAWLASGRPRPDHRRPANRAIPRLI
jgi:hypothetical protein